MTSSEYIPGAHCGNCHKALIIAEPHIKISRTDGDHLSYHFGCFEEIAGLEYIPPLRSHPLYEYNKVLVSQQDMTDYMNIRIPEIINYFIRPLSVGSLRNAVLRDIAPRMPLGVAVDVEIYPAPMSQSYELTILYKSFTPYQFRTYIQIP